MNRARLRIGVVLAAVGMSTALALVPSAAVAAVPTAIEFTSTEPVTAQFGEAWSTSLVLTTTYPDGPVMRLTPVDGTVDVYLSGIGEPFAAALPIEQDGTVYFSQPLDKPLLATGSYTITAIFNPAPGGYYSTSQTSVPAALEITGFAVGVEVEASNDASVSPDPIITARVTGDYVEKIGGAPAGTWLFEVVDKGGASVFESSVAQEHGSKDPVRVPVTAKLADGTTYTVRTTFTVVDELVAGITVADAPTATFETPGTTFADALGARLPFPWWIVLAVGVLLVGLVTTVIILAVKLSRRSPADPAPPTIPGEPQAVEELSWDDAGITPPPPPLPESTTWLLSDADPLPSESDTGQPAGEAPTERLQQPWER